MRQRAKIYFNEMFAGVLEKSEDGFSFTYDREYLENENAVPISINLPLRKELYTNNELFPFFVGLIPEGWLFELDSKILKIDPNDYFGMLLATCKDCVGAVSVIPEEEE